MRLNFIQFKDGVYMLSNYKRTRTNEPKYSYGVYSYIDKLKQRFPSVVRNQEDTNNLFMFLDEADDAAFQLYLHDKNGIEL